MEKLYLDWNIFTALKEDEPLITRFKEIITQNPDWVIPYSFAHLYDLSKTSNDINDKYVQTDLYLLESYSLKHYLSFDFTKHAISLLIARPLDIFPSFSKQHNSFPFHLSEDNPLEKLLIQSFKVKSTKINFNDWKKYPNSERFLAFFKRTQENNNVYNLMLDFGEFYECLVKDHNLLKELRRSMHDSLMTQNNDINDDPDPINLINSILSLGAEPTSFEKMIETSHYGDNSPINSIFMRFVLAYYMLDFLGYSKDKFKKKNLFSNFNTDSYHVFFAAHCDYLISNDESLISKARVLYKYFETDTISLTLSEFLDKYKSYTAEIKSPEDLRNVINISYTRDHDTIPFESNSFANLELTVLDKNPIFGFFNRLYRRTYTNGDLEYVLKRKRKPFTNQYFYSTLQFLTNRLVSELGRDSFNRGLFLGYELDEIKNKTWDGRFWISARFSITYNISWDSFEPYLILLEK